MSLPLLKSQFEINDLRARDVGCTSNGIILTNNAMSATLTRLFGGEDQDWSHIAAASVGQSLGNGIVQGLSRPTFTDEQAQQRADVFILNDEALAEKYDPNYRPAPLFADASLGSSGGVLDSTGLSVEDSLRLQQEVQRVQRQQDAAAQFVSDVYVLNDDTFSNKYPLDNLPFSLEGRPLSAPTQIIANGIQQSVSQLTNSEFSKPYSQMTLWDKTKLFAGWFAEDVMRGVVRDRIGSAIIAELSILGGAGQSALVLKYCRWVILSVEH
ncbi:MAG: hypothetical protein AAGB12_05990 [Pseudomonadota bacterium]